MKGAGYDQLDPAALSSRSILATNVPTAVDDATADTAVFLLLGALRNFNTSLLALRQDKWRGEPAPSLGHDPQGKLLGILGMGGIGRNLAKKCKAFGMKLQYHNRNRLSSTDLEVSSQFTRGLAPALLRHFYPGSGGTFQHMLLTRHSCFT